MVGIIMFFAALIMLLFGFPVAFTSIFLTTDLGYTVVLPTVNVPSSSKLCDANMISLFWSLYNK